MKYANVTYMGINIFNHSRIEYYYDNNNNETFKEYTLKSVLDEEYKNYLSAINN